MKPLFFTAISLSILMMTLDYVESKTPPYKDGSCILVDMRVIGKEASSPSPAYLYIESSDLSARKSKAILISSKNEYSARYESYTISFARLRKIPAMEVSCD